MLSIWSIKKNCHLVKIKSKSVRECPCTDNDNIPKYNKKETFTA